MKISIIVAVIVVQSIFIWVPNGTVGSQTRTPLGGTYKFKSETTTVLSPKRSVEKRTEAEWSGYFIFADGHFSVSLMDKTRNGDWFTEFPKNINEVGYESFAGTFRIDKNKLMLIPDIELHPFFDRHAREFEFEVRGNTLVLRETLGPTVERMNTSERVIVLEKI